jgi:hypothetical protein
MNQILLYLKTYGGNSNKGIVQIRGPGGLQQTQVKTHNYCLPTTASCIPSRPVIVGGRYGQVPATTSGRNTYGGRAYKEALA